MKELSFAEQKEICVLFENWLHKYTDEVIYSVIDQKDEILSNEFAMNLLKELYEREQSEANDFQMRIRSWLFNGGLDEKFSFYNNCLTHSNSYRDILYDMYIRNK